jgi:hypothetical protein
MDNLWGGDADDHETDLIWVLLVALVLAGFVILLPGALSG